MKNIGVTTILLGLIILKTTRSYKVKYEKHWCYNNHSLTLPVLTVPVTTEVMSLILGHGHGEVYSMQENVIKHVMIGGFLQVLGVSYTNKSCGNRYIVGLEIFIVTISYIVNTKLID